MAVISNSQILGAVYLMGRYQGIGAFWDYILLTTQPYYLWPGQIKEIDLGVSGNTTLTLRKPGVNVHPLGYGSATTFLKLAGYGSGASTVTFVTSPVSTIKWCNGIVPSTTSDATGVWYWDIAFIYFSGDVYGVAVLENVGG